MRLNHLRWKLTLALVSTLLSAAVVAAFGEIAFRYRERHRSEAPTNMPLLYYRHSRLRHAMIRNNDYFGWVHVNNHGFRGRDVSLEKDPGTLRIMAVGASTTFCPGIGDDAAWPAQLELGLKRRIPDLRVEVLNAGVPGYRVLDNLIRLQTELHRFRPDLMVFYGAHNDLYAALREDMQTMSKTPDQMPVVTPWGHWLSRHSMLYAKVLARWKHVRYRMVGRQRLDVTSPDDAVWSDRLELGTEKFQRDLTSLVAVAQALGIPVALLEVVHVSSADTAGELDSAAHRRWTIAAIGPTNVVLSGYVRYNDVIRVVAARTGATYIPAGSFGQSQNSGWYLEDDALHFNEAGAERMAEHLADALVRSGVVGMVAPTDSTLTEDQDG